MTVGSEKVIKAQNGDDAALEEIVACFMPYLKAYANSYYILGGDKDDIIQEGMLGLFCAVRDYKEDLASFETFALRCIRGRILTAIRLANAKKHFALNTGVIFSEYEESEIGDPMEVILKEEWRNAFYVSMEKDLSITENRVTRMYLQGYGYAEICKITGLGEKSVDNALQRAKKKLAAALDIDD